MRLLWFFGNEQHINWIDSSISDNQSLAMVSTLLGPDRDRSASKTVFCCFGYTKPSNRSNNTWNCINVEREHIKGSAKDISCSNKTDDASANQTFCTIWTAIPTSVLLAVFGTMFSFFLRASPPMKTISWNWSYVSIAVGQLILFDIFAFDGLLSGSNGKNRAQLSRDTGSFSCRWPEESSLKFGRPSSPMYEKPSRLWEPG